MDQTCIYKHSFVTMDVQCNQEETYVFSDLFVRATNERD